jgi:hypothetical protein
MRPFAVNTFAAMTTTTTRTEQKHHIAVKFDVGHGGPCQDHDGGHVCVTVKCTVHSCHQWSANLTTMILEPRAYDFVTNIRRQHCHRLSHFQKEAAA